MASCRICYGGDTQSDVLVNPCECRGSVEFLHRGCLEQWIRVSMTQRCELCNTAYTIEEMVLEEVYVPSIVCIRLVSRPYVLFFLWMMIYFIYLAYKKSLEETPWGNTDTMAYLTSTAHATPSLLSVLMLMQGFVLVPAIYILKDKARYLKYLLWNPPRTTPRPLPVIGSILGGYLLSQYYPISGAIVVLFMMSHLYRIHTSVVIHINAEILHIEEEDEEFVREFRIGR